jgi:hypothetical protein
MDKVQKLSGFRCYTPLSEPFGDFPVLLSVVLSMNIWLPIAYMQHGVTQTTSLPVDDESVKGLS